MANTANYGWQKPTVGGDSGSWGSIINAALDAIDSQLHTIAGGSGGALPLSGGALTGRVDLLTATYKRVDKGAVSGAVTLDLATANYFSMTISGPTSLSIANPVPGTLAQGFVMRVVNGGSAAMTWPNTFRFPSGSAPSLTAAGVDVLVAISDDNGASWRVTVAMKDVR